MERAAAVSLFAEYPPNEPTRQRSETCCEEIRDRPLVEHLVHALAHSRVPFTAAALAALARLEPWDAEGVIAGAVRAGEVGEVEPETYMESLSGLYIGRLGRRR